MGVGTHTNLQNACTVDRSTSGDALSLGTAKSGRWRNSKPGRIRASAERWQIFLCDLVFRIAIGFMLGLPGDACAYHRPTMDLHVRNELLKKKGKKSVSLSRPGPIDKLIIQAGLGLGQGPHSTTTIAVWKPEFRAPGTVSHSGPERYVHVDRKIGIEMEMGVG